MDLRKKELENLKSFTQNVETEVTMLLQSLQWDRKRLLEGSSSAFCQYDANHIMSKDTIKAHESKCALRSLGYTETDELLPDPPDDRAHTLVKFSNNQIQQIINEAANADPLFKKGGVSHQPLSLARLQLVYTADERRALHDAVVAAVPSCHDLGDLALAGSKEDEKQGNAVKSRVEILAELRNMKRRRTKYRVAAKTKNYSDVLRDVIKTQMESYSEAVSGTLPMKVEENLGSQCDSGFKKANDKSYFSTNKDGKYDSVKSRENNEGRREVSVSRKNTYDANYDDSRQRVDKIRKETSNKRYDNRYDRSNSSKRHDSHKGRDRNRDHDKEDNVETPHKRYKSGNEYDKSKSSHGSSHRHKSRIDEENGHRRESSDERKNKYNKRRSYDHDVRHSESRDYKEDKYKRQKIKDEPIDQSKESSSKNSHQSDKKRSRRSRSRERHRECQKMKHVDKDNRKYDEQSGGSHYKRYYDVKKEDT